MLSIVSLTLFSNCFYFYSEVNANTLLEAQLVKARSFTIQKNENWRKKFRIKPYRDLEATRIERFSPKLNKLLQRFSYYESEGQWKIFNEYGYMGKFQFGTYAMIALNKQHITTHSFRMNPYIFPPDVQDSCVVAILYLNYLTAKDIIDQNCGVVINDIQMNHFNMMVAMNHVGCAGFMPYLNSRGKIVPKDGNGSTIEFYLHEFEDVEVDLDEMKKIKEAIIK
jgi:hypothetical protein